MYVERQICKGDIVTVAGVFEDHSRRCKKLPVVRPGTQTRRFTHILDTVKAYFLHVERINVNITPWQTSNRITLSILQIYLKVKLGIC